MHFILATFIAADLCLHSDRDFERSTSQKRNSSNFPGTRSNSKSKVGVAGQLVHTDSIHSEHLPGSLMPYRESVLRPALTLSCVFGRTWCIQNLYRKQKTCLASNVSALEAPRSRDVPNTAVLASTNPGGRSQSENRRIQINYPGTGNNSQFTYDGSGNIVTIIETVGGTVSSTKQFVWADGVMRESRNSSGSVTAQYFGFGEVIGGTNYYWTKDHLNSIREMTTSAGLIAEQLSYDPYGRVNQLQGSVMSDFDYAGYYHHNSSSLRLTLNRAYNASLGRWISRDPIGESGGSNLYSYVDNDSISFVDPTGLDKFSSGNPFNSIFNKPVDNLPGTVVNPGTTNGSAGGGSAAPAPAPATPDYKDCNRKCKGGSKCITIRVNALSGSTYGTQHPCVCPEDPAAKDPNVQNGVKQYLEGPNNTPTQAQHDAWINNLGGLINGVKTFGQ